MRTHTLIRPASVCLLALLISTMACSVLSDLEGTAALGMERTTRILDEAIVGIQNNSSDWQNVLRETEDKLVEETQSTIRNEVSDLLYRGIAASGAEIRCDIDFVAGRVLLGLKRIKAELIGGEVPPLEPQLCSVVPLAIDQSLIAQGRLNRLEFYGYDLDAGELQVLLQDGDRLVDISQMLNRPTHYHLTLTLGGSTGVPLTATSQRIILMWAGTALSTISVIQPATPLCKKRLVTHQPSALQFIPPKVDNGADSDFFGAGPEVRARVQLLNKGTAVSAELFMSAKETWRDWTWVQGSRIDQVYLPEPGWRVTSMLVPSSDDGSCPPYATCFSYTDTDTAADIFSVGNGPVQRLEFVGDEIRNEAGTRTGMTVTFNPLRFELSEIGDCVTEAELSQVKSLGLISPETLHRLTPATD